MLFLRVLPVLWWRRLRLVAGALAACLALFWLAALVMPPVLKQQIETRGSATLGRSVTLGGLQLHPWSLAIEVSDVRVASADGQSTQLQIGGLYAQVSLASLIRLAPVLDALRVTQPSVQLTRLANGHYDVDDVLQRLQSAPSQPDAAPARFSLYNVELQDGSFDLTDQAVAPTRMQRVRHLQLSLPFLSSLEAQREVLVRPHLAFEFNGSVFDTDAQGQPFAVPPRGEASLRIAHLDLTPYLGYLPKNQPVQLQGAVLDTALTFKFTQSPKPALHIGGSVDLSDLRLADQNGAKLLQLASLHAVLGDVQPLVQRVQLESLTLVQPQLQLARDRAGRLNLAALLAPRAPAQTAPTPAAPTPAGTADWHLALTHFALQEGQVQWHDAAVAPAAALVLGADLTVNNVAWPLDPAHAAAFSGALTLSGSATKTAALKFQGSVTGAAGTASATVSDLDLALAAPYVSRFLVPGVKGTLEAQVSTDWQADKLTVQVPRAALRDGALTAPGAAAAQTALPSFKQLELKDVAMDLQSRQLRVGSLALRAPQLSLQRDAQGQWQFERWLKPQPATPAAPRGGTAKPAWAVSVADLRLADGAVSLRDQQPVRPAYLALSGLQLQAAHLTLDGKQPAALHVRVAVGSGLTDPGTLKFDGSAMWAPMRLDGQLDARQLPAHVVAPYLLDKVNLDLLRADASFKGRVHYADAPTGPEWLVRGDGAVDDVKVNSYQPVQSTGGTGAEPPDTLLSWTSLALPGIVARQKAGLPPQVQMGDVALSDFFMRLIVNPQGRLVLQDVVKGNNSAPNDAPAASAAQAPGAASGPQIVMGPIHLINGQVAFSDRFIKPNYSAELSELNGSLGRISTQPVDGVPATAMLVLHGRAQGSASLDVSGNVNPLARPLALDIQAKVRDLELSPLSSYAIRYAGYGIERGRLSVDVAYRVTPDAQLSATNHLVLNQLTFGDAVPDAPASLPVKLVTALLSDRDGVINLNLPISGSLDDPQFSIWPVVWKILGNLVTKVLTAPFSLFSGGDDGAGTDLSNVLFEPGTARITASGMQGLDRLASELLQRPTLDLTIVGTSSLEQEADAIRHARLDALLLAEQRREAGDGAAAVSTGDAVSAAQAPALLKEVYRRTDLSNKPRNLIGMSKDLPPAQMEALLLANMAVTPDSARTLALQRGVAVRDYLSSRQLPLERLFLGSGKVLPVTPGWLPQAELSISNH